MFLTLPLPGMKAFQPTAVRCADLPQALANPSSLSKHRVDISDRSCRCESSGRDGRALQLAPASPRSPERQRLSDLTAHRNNITAMIVALKNRSITTPDQWIRRSILQHVRALQGRRARVEAGMEAVIQEHDELRDQSARLRSVKGIGPFVSATAIAQIPELGQLDRRRIAALAGLAPHANDSGHRRGKRSIWGGRGTLRRCLYLAALAASRFDPRFRTFKERLIAAGKARKLVIVACARKLLTVLNAMTRAGTTYLDTPT